MDDAIINLIIGVIIVFGILLGFYCSLGNDE